MPEERPTRKRKRRENKRYPYKKIRRVQTKKVPITLTFKKKDGTKVKIKAIKIVRK